MDPFKVVWDYDTFYPQQMAGGVSLNPANVGTQNYLRRQPQQHYNSFIFGNSRSIYYPIMFWKPLLPAGSRCYHYDAADESLLGIVQKLRLIDSTGDSLSNVLMVVDARLLSMTDCQHWHLCETPPQLTNYRNWIEFHWYNLKAFLTPSFLLAYSDYSLFHQLRPYMLKNGVLTEDMFVYDPKTNECDFRPMEQLIEQGKYYTEERKQVFVGQQFPDSISPAVLGVEQRKLLDEMCSMFRKNGSRVHIVISPLYNQIKLNPADRAELERRFGVANVHDYSGINKWNVDYHNYYEASHYRTCVARDILAEIVW